MPSCWIDSRRPGNRLRATVFAVLLLGLLAATAPPARGQELRHDFRNTEVLPPVLQLFGRDARKLATLEPEGLRIRLPAERENLAAGVGVAPSFPLTGDFEITIAYELLAVEPPTAGRGSGVTIYVEVGAPMQAAATLARVSHPKKGEGYIVWRALRDGQGKINDPVQFFAAEDVRSGRLRLSRVGATLRYLVAEGDSDAFRALSQAEFLAGETLPPRFAANSGNSPTAVDIRLRELQIHAASAPDSVPTPERPRLGRILGLAIGLAILIAAGCGIWLWQSRRAKRSR